MSRNIIAQTVKDELQLLIRKTGLPVSTNKLISLVLTDNQRDRLLQLEYWKVHDTNSNNLVNRVWVQQACRQHEFSHSSTKACLRRNDVSSVYNTIFVSLVNIFCYII
jgi:hypothetical protein